MTNFVEIILPTENATQEIGKKLSHLAQIGDVFCLFGTLGMGKSVLARAFVQELCGNTEVPSPTFTLLQTYEAPDFDIYHFDLYRIKSPDEIFEIGVEDAIYSGVSLIEWPEKMSPYLPRDVIKLELLPFNNGRKLIISSKSDKKFARISSISKFFR